MKALDQACEHIIDSENVGFFFIYNFNYTCVFIIIFLLLFFIFKFRANLSY